MLDDDPAPAGARDPKFPKDWKDIVYCPNCRGEYRVGFSWCKDCDVALVDDLPLEQGIEFIDLVEVLSIADVGQIALIKSMLDAAEIPHLAQGENFNLARNIAVRLLVPRDCLDQAQEILADFL